MATIRREQGLMALPSPQHRPADRSLRRPPARACPLWWRDRTKSQRAIDVAPQLRQRTDRKRGTRRRFIHRQLSLDNGRPRRILADRSNELLLDLPRSQRQHDPVQSARWIGRAVRPGPQLRSHRSARRVPTVFVVPHTDSAGLRFLGERHRHAMARSHRVKVGPTRSCGQGRTF